MSLHPAPAAGFTRFENVNPRISRCIRCATCWTTCICKRRAHDIAEFLGSANPASQVEIVRNACEIIHLLTDSNPIQVIVDAVINRSVDCLPGPMPYKL